MACRGIFHAVMGNGSTFLAPVTAYPTTTLTMALYQPDKGRILKISGLHYFVASGTPGVGAALLACVTTVTQARPTLSTGINGGYANTIISSLKSGGQPGDTKALFINAITLTGPQPAWVPAGGNSAGTATATIASHAAAFDVNYLGFEIGEGHMLGVTLLSGAGTTPLYGFGVTFEEWDA